MSRQLRLIRFSLMLACMSVSASVYADVKVKSRQTMQGQTYESTTYIKGKRQRSEQNTGGLEMVNITQCDLRRDLRIMPQSKTYMVESYDRVDATQSTRQPAVTERTGQQPAAPQKGGVVTTIYTLKDTGERKQMFGYTARHILTTMETESSPDACTQTKSKMQTDGWYIDVAFALECDMARYQGYRPKSEKPGCQDRYEMKQIGAGKIGYPVWVKTTMFDDSGKETYSMLTEVIELSQATLADALFDVPAGYREVTDSSALYASAAAMGAGNAGGDDADGPAATESGMSANARNLSQPTSNVSTELSAKKPGVVRFGLATVKTGSVGAGLNPNDLAGAIGNTLADYLKSPNVELVRLEARLPSQADAEARQKECDYVIYTTASHKKGGGGGMFGKALGNIASSAAGHIPYGGTAGSAAARGAAITAAYTAASVSGNVKSKDELTLDLKLQAPGDVTTVAKQFKAKAKSDGEDIISPLAEQAAQAIIDAAKQ